MTLAADGFHDRPDVNVPIERVPAWANTYRIVYGIDWHPNTGLQVCPPCDVWWARSTRCWVCGKPGQNLSAWLDAQREQERGAA